MEKTELLKKLVEIPSFGEGDLLREKNVCDWLEDYCKQNLRDFSVEKFKAKNGINTLLVLGSQKPSVVLACHMDTVPPSKQEQTQLTIIGDKAFGLGTKDMKAGCVAALVTAKNSKNKANVGILFYSDEEYTQQGIQEATQILKQKQIKPKLIVSPESRFNIGYGARGIIVAKITVKGLRAHSSRPKLGKDAIKGFFKIVQTLEKNFGKTNGLGKTTFTISYINGGLLDDNGEVKIGASSIPDICEGVISVRNSQNDFDGKIMAEKIQDYAQQLGLQIDSTVTEDFPPRLVNKKFVQDLVKQTQKLLGMKLELGDPKLAGYNDAAILAKQLDCPVINFGPYGEDNHTAGEWVSLQSIDKTVKILRAWIENL